MPEAYTHIKIAKQAAQRAGLCPYSQEAFLLGSQGPDILFCYQVWKSGKSRTPNLPALGTEMHHTKTGEFLQALIGFAQTQVQKAYTAGFLCHYGTDCTIHPYVEFLAQEGQLYGQAGGHGYFEIALDSLLHQKDLGDWAVPVRDNCPRLPRQELSEIAELLQKAVNKTYEMQLGRQPFLDTYAHTRFLRSLFVSRFHIKRAIFWAAERIAFGGVGFITGHITPAKLKQPLPSHWIHPATKQPMQRDIWQLLEDAESRSAELLNAYTAWQQGKLAFSQLTEVIGNFSYDDGGCCKDSLPQEGAE